MGIDIVRILSEMNAFSWVIVGTLLLGAVGSLAVLLERTFVLMATRNRAAQLAEATHDALQNGRYDQVLQAATAGKTAELAVILRTGIETWQHARRRQRSAQEALELTRRELARLAEVQSAGLRRGFSVLATVGSVAPFVGLLGTVVGIIEAFGKIAEQGSGGLGVVSGGISEALVVTALGLVVAIPAVLAFNFLTGKAEALDRQLQAAAGEFLDHLEFDPPRDGLGTAERSGASVAHAGVESGKPAKRAMEVADAAAA